MSFQPVIPFGGYAGWTFLQRTIAQQQTAFQASAASNREEAYFRDNIAKVTSAEDLVSDRRLLRVALTAFGLEGDVNSGAFVRKLLEGGTEDGKALANRLADKRYLAFVKAFDFSGAVPASAEKGFADGILSLHATRRFETAVGAQSETMRLALNAQRELEDLTTSDSSENAKWFGILGNKPLRIVFETAFGLPTGFGQMDIDRQLQVMKTRANSVLGSDSVSQLSDPERMEKLLRSYVIRADMQSSGASYSSANTALMLLQRR
ncbi:DUF1217 domain-containing protein [Pseudogemmobacter sonorensis]|uniref:DUF1217 domain-containing protein n=1 Tax=Pseudogemmobacter sonorensis TaxID=2989681 RepID=UPI003698C356